MLQRRFIVGDADIASIVEIRDIDVVFVPVAGADLLIGARGGLLHHSATARQQCPSSSTGARHFSLDIKYSRARSNEQQSVRRTARVCVSFFVVGLFASHTLNVMMGGAGAECRPVLTDPAVENCANPRDHRYC
jgi:hypothetical protein